MLVELLRPAGPELARRWLAALLLVPESERAGLVEQIEARIVETYAQPHRPGKPAKPAGRASGEMVVSYPPTQRDGYSEQIERIYSVTAPPADAPASGRAKKKSRG
jgi:hypothetical protein